MEAALRTVYDEVTGKKLEDVNLSAVRGLTGIRETYIDLDGRTVNVEAVSNLGNSPKVLETIQRWEAT